MTEFFFDKPRDMHAFRAQLYNLLGWTYHSKAIPPAGLGLLHNAAMITSPTGAYRCNGHIRGAGYRGLKFDLYEVEANRTGAESSLQGLFKGFSGMLMSVEHYTSFLGRCIVTRDMGLLNPKQIDDMKVVRLVDSRFESLFEVYADDQVEGRALLTPDFMERLMWFDEVAHFRGLQVAFLGNRMYVALPCGTDIQFGSDVKVGKVEIARKFVRTEMYRVFYILAGVDALHACARAQADHQIDAERTAFYEAKISYVDKAIDKALSEGVLKSGAKPAYLTEDYELIDPILRGLLRPRC